MDDDDFVPAFLARRRNESPRHLLYHFCRHLAVPQSLPTDALLNRDIHENSRLRGMFRQLSQNLLSEVRREIRSIIDDVLPLFQSLQSSFQHNPEYTLRVRLHIFRTEELSSDGI